MLDPLLLRFVEAADEDEAERELGALVEQHALPLARAIVRRKLRAYADDRAGRDASDRDDVVGDAMVTLVERLRAARADRDKPPIENFISYAAVVVHSACAHYVRCRYPERARLKNRLRYVFSTDPRLALWTADREELACGLAAWRGRRVSAAAQTAGRQLESAARQWSADRAKLTSALVDLLSSIGEPIDFETLVGIIASTAGIVEPRAAGDASLVASTAPRQDEMVERRGFLGRVWTEVRELPVRQRLALLLNLRDTSGSGLLWLLPIAGVATLREIARVLEIPDGEFAALWPHIPLDDAAIADRLGCTRQQVINLRMAARKRLTNRVGSPGGGRRADAGAEVNLARFSASLKGSA